MYLNDHDSPSQALLEHPSGDCQSPDPGVVPQIDNAFDEWFLEDINQTIGFISDLVQISLLGSFCGLVWGTPGAVIGAISGYLISKLTCRLLLFI